jgi:signal transduction histidine kinase
VSTPLDTLRPRSVLGGLLAAFREDPGAWPVLLVPAPWFLANGAFFAAQNGLDPGRAAGAAVLALAAHLVVEILLLRLILPQLHKLIEMRSAVVVLLCYAAGGVSRAAVMAWITPLAEAAVVRWLWLGMSWGLNAAIWMGSAAILVSWSHRLQAQRLQLEAEYERQVLTRGKDAVALAQAGRQLSEVRASTHQALAEIRSRLHPEMSAEELAECVEVIDEVVAGMVRPTSHDLARMKTEIEATPASALWRGWREVVPALIRSWPVARPFQPALVGALCLPMVVAAELIHLPHQVDEGSLVAMAVLGLHMALLTVAERALVPTLARIPPRVGVAVVLAVYLILYLVGLTLMILAFGVGLHTPLEAFLVPPLLATVAGGVSALAKVQEDESRAARTVIQRTNWEVRHTRQRLWAQRRRLAMSLHGRVQANLTAASLTLGMARERMLAGERLDQDVVERVRSTLALADLIDQPPATSPDVRLDVVAKVWSGVLAVELDLRPGGLALLKSNLDLTDACVEVVREILLNAVRHSCATSSEVVIGAAADSLLCIRATELALVRQPLGSAGGAGLGRSLIDSLAVDWAESDGDDGRVTVAMLAAGNARSVAADARSRLTDVSDLR